MQGMRLTRPIRAILVPAVVFQSVIFGGAYGTGREIAEFVSKHGPLGGLAALALIALGFTAVMVVSLELARQIKAYDYRTFIKALIGPGWIMFEILFVLSILLVLAVSGSAAGEILLDQFGLPKSAGIALMFASVVLLNYFGRKSLENSMVFCILALTLILAIISVSIIAQSFDSIARTFATETTQPGWLASGLQYALYNVAAVPVILYCARDIGTRKEAVAAGCIAGLAGVFPALVFHVIFMSAYPDVLQQALPVYWLVGQYAGPVLFVSYVIILFAMIIQTAAGLLQGLIERLDTWSTERRGHSLRPLTHALTAVVVLATSLLLAQFGIIALVARGYGSLAWIYLLVFVVPLFTIGIRRIIKGYSA